MSEKEDKVTTTEADKIWVEISGLPIDVFALSGQVVENHVTKIDLPGKDLYVKLKSSAVLPALEETLGNSHFTKGKKYAVESGEGYVVVRRGQDNSLVVKAMEDMAKKRGA